jgi:hypothetical protein
VTDQVPALHGPVVAWLQKEFGGAFQELETFPATAVGNTSVVGNDPNSAALLFVNIGAQDVILKLRQDLPVATGIRLGANGGGTVMTIRDDMTLPTREWFAASPGGASQLYILRLSLFGQAAVAP